MSLSKARARAVIIVTLLALLVNMFAQIDAACDPCGNCADGRYCLVSCGCCSLAPADWYSQNCGIQQCPANSDTGGTTGNVYVTDCKCSAGYYLDASSSCSVCLCGTWSARGASGSCTSAGPSKYASGTGNTAATSCPAGKYCTGPKTCTPVSCAAGTYSTGGASSCTDCACGHYAGGTSSTSCSVAGSGKYASSTGNTAATPCPAGKYCPGSTTCTPLSCAAGTYSTSGSSSCTPCPCGSYSAAASSGSCTNVGAGQYASSTGNTGPTQCPAGSYCPAGACSPTPCAAGSFSAAGAGSCTLCPCGTHASSSGATSCVSCSPGYYLSGTGNTGPTCTSCGAGRFCGPSSARCSPSLCPAGTSSAALTATSSATCVSCVAGTYATSTGSSSCTKCAAGTASSVIGASSASVCTDCACGSFSPSPGGAASCTLANPGYFVSGTRNTGQTQCAKNYYQPDAGKCSCNPCAPGYISPLAATSCTRCTEGFERVLFSCVPCPAGTYSNSTAGNEDCTLCWRGSWASSAQSVTCSGRCPESTYSTVLGATNSSVCVSCGYRMFTRWIGAGSYSDCFTHTVSKTTSDAMSFNSHSLSRSAPSGTVSRSMNSPSSSVSLLLTLSDSATQSQQPTFTRSIPDTISSTGSSTQTHGTASQSHTADATAATFSLTLSNPTLSRSALSITESQTIDPRNRMAPPRSRLAVAGLGAAAMLSILASPIAIRALSVLALTQNLCHPDGTADAPPPLEFPQSVFPSLTIYVSSPAAEASGETQLDEIEIRRTRGATVRQITLPQFRGAVVANVILGPLLATMICAVGFGVLFGVREYKARRSGTKVDDEEETVSSFVKRFAIRGVILGRAMQIIAFCLEGAIAASVFLLAEEEHVPGADITLGVFGLLIVITLVCSCFLLLRALLAEHGMRFVEAAVKKRKASGEIASGGADEDEAVIEASRINWFWGAVLGRGVWIPSPPTAATATMASGNRSRAAQEAASERLEQDWRKSLFPLFAKFGFFVETAATTRNGARGGGGAADEPLLVDLDDAFASLERDQQQQQQQQETAASSSNQQTTNHLEHMTTLQVVRFRLVQASFFVDCALTGLLAIVRGLLLAVPCSFDTWLVVATIVTGLAVVFVTVLRPLSSNARLFFEWVGNLVIFLAVFVLLVTSNSPAAVEAVLPFLVTGILFCTCGTIVCSALTFLRTRLMKFELVPKEFALLTDDNSNGGSNNNSNGRFGDSHKENAHVLVDLMEMVRHIDDDEMEMDIQMFLNQDAATEKIGAPAPEIDLSMLLDNNNNGVADVDLVDLVDDDCNVPPPLPQHDADEPAMSVWTGIDDGEDDGQGYDVDQYAGADEDIELEDVEQQQDAVDDFNVAAGAGKDGVSAYESEFDKQRRMARMLDELGELDGDALRKRRQQLEEAELRAKLENITGAAALQSKMNKMLNEKTNET